MKTMYAVMCVMAAGSVAMADGVELRYLGKGAGSNVKINFDNSTQNVFAGQLLHEFSNGTGIMADINGSFYTYCTDLTQYVTSTKKWYDVTPLNQMPNAPGVTPMSFEQAQAIRNLFAGVAGAQFAQNASNDFATAFQLMVWEIVWDFGPGESIVDLSLTTGAFTATKTNGSALSSGVINNFNALKVHVGQLSGASGLVGLASGTAQDQLFVVPGPGTGVLAGIGALMALKRRRRSS
ncbi:MAG: hypothetical protein KF866_12720 [Phycisphaeraceae bacterium]|nr:hypothetical protein [Phycisphaeraceae bacterium]